VVQEINGVQGAGRQAGSAGTGQNRQVIYNAAGTLPVTQPNGPLQTQTAGQALDRYIQLSLVTTSFLGVPVRVHSKLVKPLHDAQDSLQYAQNHQKHGIVTLSGYQGPKTGLHSVGCAVDINYETSPFLMHEEGEGALDTMLGEIYERIAQFVLGRASVIPLEITHYFNPRDATRRDTLYRSLKEESDAMRTYFGFYMINPETHLDSYLQTSTGSDRAKKTKWLGVAAGAVPGWKAALGQIQKDYTTLTGRGSGPQIMIHVPGSPNYLATTNPCDAGMCYPTPQPLSQAAGASRTPDAPFVDKGTTHRDPQYGFLSFDHDVVVALLDQGFTWGAVGFGAGGLTVGGSGDVMHFELSVQGRQVLSDAKAAVGGV